jgi:hypothetical protein
MRTVQPSIVIGSYTWDQDLLPRDEFQIRTDALHRVMDANGWQAVLIYGDAAEHAALAYFSNLTPRLRWGMALLPRQGDPRLIAAMSPRDIPATRPMTWIDDVCSEANKDAFESWLAQFSGAEPFGIGAAGLDLMRPPLFQRLEKGLVKSWRGGAGIEAAVIEAERAARLRAAQDVRMLSSLDGGRTFSPFRGSFEKTAKSLAAYVAVKHMGYWADTFVSAGNGIPACSGAPTRRSTHCCAQCGRAPKQRRSMVMPPIQSNRTRCIRCSAAASATASGCRSTKAAA